MKLNLLFVICLLAFLGLSYARKTENKAVFLAGRRGADLFEEDTDENEVDTSCKGRLEELNEKLKSWKGKFKRVKASLNKKILKLRHKFNQEKEEDTSDDDELNQEESFIEKTQAVFLAKRKNRKGRGVRGVSPKCRERVNLLKEKVKEAKSKFQGMKGRLNKKLLKLKYKFDQMKNNKNDEAMTMNTRSHQQNNEQYA